MNEREKERDIVEDITKASRDNGWRDEFSKDLISAGKPCPLNTSNVVCFCAGRVTQFREKP